MIDDHKTQTIRYAYQRYIDYSYDLYKSVLGTSEVPEDLRKEIDDLWSRIMQHGAEAFFLCEAAVEDDDVDFEIANFFIWTYQRDSCIFFRPYWQVLRETWRNYKAMGLDLFFENTEGYSIQET